MLKWRRRNEGFEWREYVRTTILVRRKNREQRAKEIGAAAVDQLKNAGREGLRASAAGALSAGTGLRAGLAVATAWSISSLRAAATSVIPLVAAVGRLIRRTAHLMTTKASQSFGPYVEPLLAPLRRPGIELALRIAAPISGLAAAYRAHAFGFDADAAVAAFFSAITAALAILLWTTSRKARDREALGLLDQIGDKLVLLPGFDRLYPRQATLTAGALLCLGVFAAWVVSSTAAVTPGRAPPKPPTRQAAGAPSLATSRLIGRATALSSSSLRVAGTTVHLDAMEPLEPDQTCAKPGGATWRCGEAAKVELARAVRGQRVACDITSTTDGDRPLARCFVDGNDIAEMLIRSGHAFAAAGFFTAYSAAEADARNGKKGIWNGAAERPSEYRAKKWDEAKRTAPDGCPIKGRITSGARVYVLPWAPSYEKLRVSRSKGERWFCSEDEARAAGFRSQS